MTENAFSATWVSRWRDTVNAELRIMTDGFEERHGYPPGENLVRAADATDLEFAREYSRDMLHVKELALFYTVVGEAVLSDVGNGYFIHSARHVLRQYAAEGAVFLPDSDDPHGMVFASDGGGLLFVADFGGAVHRSASATVDGEFEKVADDVPEFLGLVHRSVTRFVATGEPGYL